MLRYLISLGEQACGVIFSFSTDLFLKDEFGKTRKKENEERKV
jgi:hypothetical protein